MTAVMKPTIFSLAYLFIGGLLSLTGLAQVTEATLKLSITDAQNSAVIGSSVEIINEETNVRRAAVTDGNGQATIAGLPSGQYTVSVKASGFKAQTQRGLRLNVGQTAE